MGYVVDTSELEQAPLVIQRQIEKSIREAFGTVLGPAATKTKAAAKVVSRRQWVDVDAHQRQRFRQLERVRAHRRRVAKRRGFYFSKGKQGRKRGVRLSLRTGSKQATAQAVITSFAEKFTEAWGG